MSSQVKCKICHNYINELYCTTNVCRECCETGQCPFVAGYKAIENGTVKLRVIRI